MKQAELKRRTPLERATETFSLSASGIWVERARAEVSA